MDDELLIKKPETSCLALIAMAGCPKTMAEAELVKNLLFYSRDNVKTGGDIRQSAEVRDICDNPESKAEKYKCLLDACRFRYLSDTFKTLAGICDTAAQGVFAQAMGAPKFSPVIFLPDNEFGAYVRQEAVAMFEAMAVVQPGELKPVDNPEEVLGELAKPQKKIIAD